jgi:amino acid adenylation domain-containing protein
LRLQYKDFSRWQNQLFESGVIKSQEDYWLGLYADTEVIPRLDLAADYRRPEVFTFAGDHYIFELEKEDALAFKGLAIQNGGTLYMNILTALNTLFYKYSGQRDIIIGSVTAGRPHADLQHIFGMFVNTLAMRNYPEGEKTYRFFLKEVIGSSVEAFENQDVQFEELVEMLDVERDLSRNPIFDITMVVQNVEGGQVGESAYLPAVEGEVQYTNRTSKFDMTFFFVEQEEGISVSIEYYTGIFKEETIRRLASHFKNVIKAVVTDPLIKLKDIEVMSEEERQQVVYAFNDTTDDYPKDKTIHRLFEEQVEKATDKAALTGSENKTGEVVQLTYKELNQKSGQLARVLKEKGVLADNIVAIMVERSIEMIIGILGILKAGGAYLPIDPGYPQERIEYMLKDSEAKILLTDNSSNPSCSSCFAFSPEALLNLPEGRLIHHSSFITHHSGHLSYVIYTSGSTGRPKGVMVQHRSVVNRLNWMQKAYPLGKHDVILQKTTYVFDVSVWELFWWSFHGASLCLLGPGEEKNPEAITEAVEKNHVTTMHFVPSMLNGFLEYLEGQVDLNRLAGLRRVFSSGEALMPYHVQRFSELLYKSSGTTLINLYGPTEATVDVSYFNCLKEENLENMSIPIGKPIDNIQLYVLNKEMGLQPVGAAGELCISGDGLARGYLNKPLLTAEKFIENPFEPFGRLYRTGDLVRWLADGNVEFLGRMDYQLKIRGFRIELGEIESLLLRHEKVKEAVVIDRETERGDKYLCAYIVSGSPGSIEEGEYISELREYLSGKLPDYMVPWHIVEIEKIPSTVSGKINRKALPEPEIRIVETYIGPKNRVEERLVEIWAEVLGLEKDVIGIDSNFFELGGHSIKAIELVSRIHRELEVKLPLTEVFKRRSIRGLAGYIETVKKSKYIGIKPMEAREYYELSSAQKRLYFLNRMDVERTTYNMPFFLSLGKNVEINRLEATLKRLTARHESLRTSFQVVNEGPVQGVHDDVEFETEYFDLAATEVTGEIGEIHHSKFIIQNSFIRPFDLSRAPLIRSGIIKCIDVYRMVRPMEF